MAAAGPSSRCALVVDDSAAARQELAALLAPHGFEVGQAENGIAALRLLQTRRFDLVFLDREMPVLDGPGLLRLIRARGDRVKVVLTTSTSDMRLIASTVKLGASDYLSKPVDESSLRTVLARLFGSDPGQELRGPSGFPGSTG